MASYIFRIKFAVIITAILTPALILSASPVMAEELVISGNGSSSDNQISLTVTSNTTVEQSNQESIKNDVQLDLSSGENNASDNTSADTQITTGNINTQTSIENSTNISAVSLDCCAEPQSTITVTDNGSDSQSNVDFSQNSDTQINIGQNAQIQNNVIGNGNTGENRANDNSGGNISINTGNINVILNIENKNINAVSVSAPQVNSNVNIKIAGNGSSSDNLVFISLNNNFAININNKADILNNAIWNLTTGKNLANGNTGGNVSIFTGDINLVTEIKNEDINESVIISGCCGGPNDSEDPDNSVNPSDPEDSDDPGDPSLPTQPIDRSQPQTNPNMGSSTSSNGQVLGAMTGGQILPATGVSWTIILSMVSLIMFMLGLYLRLHPGRDPAKKII
ncbi:MAG: hypothetical protein V1808_00875 [Candidatus Daviesbacteria bacterium]